MNTPVWAIAFVTVTGAVAAFDVNSLLLPGCSLIQRPTGLLGGRETAFWLRCAGSEVMVTHPRNLTGHVQITHEKQAIGYVRFFCNETTHRVFDLGGMVEIVPRESPNDLAFNKLSWEIFAARLPAAEVTSAPSPSGRSPDNVASGRRFIVRRAMLMPDNSVWRISEEVWETGYYDVLERKLLIGDASTLGIIYFAPI